MTDQPMSVTVNGKALEGRAGLTLLDVVRGAGLTGSKVGCQTGDCGACTMVVDGVAVQACQMPLTSAEGAVVTTVEGLVDHAVGAQVTQALIAEGAAQCGYCLPGIATAATAALARDGAQADIPAALSGNICRCGTHHRILSALGKVRAAMEGST